MNLTTSIAMLKSSYYANARDEPNYDYDDYDNLDVQTID